MEILSSSSREEDDDYDDDDEKEEEEEALKWAALEKLPPTYDRLGKGMLINISW